MLIYYERKMMFFIISGNIRHVTINYSLEENKENIIISFLISVVFKRFAHTKSLFQCVCRNHSIFIKNYYIVKQKLGCLRANDQTKAVRRMMRYTIPYGLLLRFEKLQTLYYAHEQLGYCCQIT